MKKYGAQHEFYKVLTVDHILREYRDEIETLKADHRKVVEAKDAEIVRLITGILATRDSLIEEPQDEAHHQLYITADPKCTSFEPWKKFEDIIAKHRSKK